MNRKQEEILAELDATLDQLILNASIIEKSNLYVLEAIEVDSLQKTQESLMARFSHTQEHLDEKTSLKKREKLQEKLAQFGLLNANLIESLSKQITPRIGRNRKKSKVRQFANSNL